MKFCSVEKALRLVAITAIGYPLALIPLALIVGGCAARAPSGQDSSTAETATSDSAASDSALSKLQLASQPGFDEQLELGRGGQADRIELASPIDESNLQSLSPEDDWIEVLILDEGVVTEHGIESITQLPSLTHLRLRQSPIGDVGFSVIANCQSLQILNLPQCDASATGIAALAKLPGLRNLRLGGVNLSDGGSAESVAEAIAKLQTLRHLHLIGVPIDDQGLRRIASLPKLGSLYLDDSDVTEAGWDWLFESHPRLHVHVNQEHHDREPNPHRHD